MNRPTCSATVRSIINERPPTVKMPVPRPVAKMAGLTRSRCWPEDERVSKPKPNPARSEPMAVVLFLPMRRASQAPLKPMPRRTPTI